MSLSDYFQSNVRFSAEDIELMSSEIGDILATLKTKNVFDIEKERPIILLDRSMAHIQFKKTELLEVHRFVSLVKKNLSALEYLIRNPSFFTMISPVERSDRIMGSIDYGRTRQMRMRESAGKKTVACLEIQKSHYTPENILLTQILFSIVLYCDKYIAFEGLVESRDKINPTIDSLKAIRNYVSVLLSKKFLRDVLPIAVSKRARSDELFETMLSRIKAGRAPEHYVGIYNLLQSWKKFLWTAQSDTEIAKHVLKYHFLSTENQNDLYECWLFCKILTALSDIYQLRFREVPRAEGTAFQSLDGSIRVTYQKRYDTGWQYEEDEWVEDRPDIAIEFHDAPTIIIDAKNSNFDKSRAWPYREQMDSYLYSAKANVGILVFSESKDCLWKPVTRNNQKIIWTSLAPRYPERNNEIVIKIMSMVRK
jgi:hypothetical protein